MRSAMMLSLGLTFLAPPVVADIQSKQVLDISYITQKRAVKPTLSVLDRPSERSGLDGALLGINDANTTAKFVGQQLTLSQSDVANTTELIGELNQQFNLGKRQFVLNLDQDYLNSAQQWALNKPVLFYNISEKADQLRHDDCSATTFHTIPSHSMATDAMAQWLLSRRLTNLLLVHGQLEDDMLMVNALKRSAKRYGLKIIDNKQWTFNSDLRRSASAEMPLFTQTLHQYDAVYVADSIKDFANYLPYNTFLPRPVVGSAGLEALSWHPRIEQWGALQLQNRFRALANRPMNEIDFSGYIAIRALASAFLATKSKKSDALAAHQRSETFGLGAYLGRKLTFRHWDQQLRMPIALASARALVSQSPQQGILHPTNELDTLGFDRRESRCQLTN